MSLKPAAHASTKYWKVDSYGKMKNAFLLMVFIFMRFEKNVRKPMLK